VRDLIRDFGRSWLTLVVLAAVAVVALAFSDAVRTRHLYLSLALFHGYLELALFGYFWARGTVPRRAT